MPVDGRFEHIVLSCNATSDHAIIWIEREAQRALDVSFSDKKKNEDYGFTLAGNSSASWNKLLELKSYTLVSIYRFSVNVGESSKYGDSTKAKNGAARDYSERSY